MNKHQLERVVIKWLNKHYGNLTPKKRSSSIFYVNSENLGMMEYDLENNRIWINHNDIWAKIESLFHLEYYDTQSIMKVWLEETYNLEGVTPGKALRGLIKSWKRITNWIN